MRVTVLPNNYSMEGKTVSINRVIDAIASPPERIVEQIAKIRETKDKDAKNSLKMDLPAFFPSGHFQRGKSLGDLVKHSGIIHLDIDDKKVSAYLNKHIDTKHLVFKFLSPSYGLKLGFKVDTIPETNEEHRWAWNHLNDIFTKGKSDQGSKSWNKQSNFSHDVDAYCNVDCEPFIVPPMPPPREYTGIPVTVQSSRDLFTMAENIVKKQGYLFAVGERNNYVYNLCCVLNKFGVDFGTADRLLAERFAKVKFPMDEISYTLKSVYRRYRNSFGAIKVNVTGRQDRRGNNTIL
jgi:hypothetical protein